ncbi:MAG: hypothetical protein RLZZ543_1325 [Bacteroidota bacterium]|jgi:hypothetical protein
MIHIRQIEDVHFAENFLCLSIDGIAYRFSLDKISKKLANADEIKRMMYKISPSGYGIHWPLIDEDLSIDGLLKNVNQ